MPKVCFGCTVQLSGGEHLLCTVCRHDLPLTEYNFSDENPVDRIFYGRINIIKASSFLYFTKSGIVKNLLHHLKYKNQEKIGEFLGDWYGSVLITDKGLPYIDVVIPVPLHPKKLKKRGYNQVDSFGKRLAKHLNVPYWDKILIKTANTRTQTQKDRLFRWQNSKNLYELRNANLLKNKKILLVDDVVTTGATLEACSRALHKAKDVEVYVATLACVPKLGM